MCRGCRALSLAAFKSGRWSVVATKPIRSTADVPGLVDALASKLDDTQFVGISRLIVSASEPADPQEGDVWLQVADSTAPSQVTGLVANGGAGEIVLTWDVATDDVAVVEYRVERSENGTTGWAEIARPAVATYTDTGLSYNVTRYYRVRAADAIPNLGEYSSVASDTTNADTTAPLLSGTLVATPGATQVVLDWTDATDAVGVTGYDVEYGTTEAYGTSVSPDPTESTATITGLIDGTLYYFRVRAHDAAGNASGWIAATATPATAVTFANDFAAGEALDTVHLGTTVLGTSSVVVASNKQRGTGTADGGWLGFDLNVLNKAVGAVWRRKVTCVSQSANSLNILATLWDIAVGSAPTPSGDGAIIEAVERVRVVIAPDGSIQGMYQNTSNEWVYWDRTNGWGAPPPVASSIGGSTYWNNVACFIRFTCTATGVKIGLYDAAEILVAETTEVPYASMRSSTNLRLVYGDHYGSSAWYTTQDTLLVSRA